MAKVILAQPNYSKVYKDIGEPVYEPPLGLTYLASVLEKNKHEVRIYDCVFPEQLEAFKKEVKWADFVGITSTTPIIEQAFVLNSLAKALNPKVKTILGGPHISSTLKRPVEFDYGVVREGESVITDIVEGKVKCPLVKGKPITPLDDIPFPARHLLDLDKYRLILPSGEQGRYGTVMSARGCPYNCVFCDSHKIFGRRTRYRTPKNVIEEFKECVDKHGITHYGFLDDTTTLNRSRWLKICEGLKPLGISYHCATRVDAIDEEVIRASKDSGCYRFHLGVESGNASVLKDVGKGITLKQVEKAFELCHKHGMSTYAYFVLGLPGDTEETIRETVDFSIKIDPDYVQYTCAMPFPGTRLYNWVEENDLWIEDLDYDSFRWYGNPVYEENVKADRLIQLQKIAYSRFYQRPKVMARTFRESWRNPVGLLKSFLNFRRFVG